MNRKILTLIIILMCCLLFFTSSVVYAAEVAYVRGASAPWGQSTNEAAMDEVFGVGNWDDLRMADGAIPFEPASGYRFIFLEGGDETAIELNDYMQNFQAQIESFVSNGGHLLLNSAPNEGGSIDFGFGGIQLIYPAYSSAVTAADPNHPIFSGPSTPVTTDYTGNYFGHAIIGNGLSPIIIGAAGDTQEGNIVLGELSFGNGLVLFGGMTTNNFHSPSPEAANLRANIIHYAFQGSTPPPVSSIPTLSEWGMIFMSLMLAGSAFWVMQRRQIS